MVRIRQEFKLIFLLLGFALYVTFFVINFTHAEPAGAGVINISTETYVVGPQSRQDSGGTITTITLSANQQDSAWKAYVGNISGKMVLKNSGGYSIYEWVLNSSSLSGNIFVTRAGSVTWANTRCANNTIVESEQSSLGMTSSDSDSINKTFNYTTHKSMTISGLAITLSNDTCPSTATYVNGTAQSVSDSSTFQEILLTDATNLVYGTFIDKNAWSYNNNGTNNLAHDFQLLVAQNKSSAVGTTYYFYADIHG